MGFLGDEKKSFFGKLQQKIQDVILMRPEIDEKTFDELEKTLITSNIGMETTMRITDRLRQDIKKMKLHEPKEVQERLKEIIKELINKGEEAHKIVGEYPLVILMVGVNGGGKTTTIAKLANRYLKNGKSVLLAAADTFRAAAGEQLQIWGDRAGVGVIKHQEGADPSAVIFDAVQAAKARNIDVLICDTAGRLQNKKNLMVELEKMSKVISREYPEARRETLLVLDATTGKNAVSQAQEFGSITELTGIVITKLDGTAKGGIAITISDEYELPIKLIGVGEGIDDLKDFDPIIFAENIFE